MSGLIEGGADDNNSPGTDVILQGLLKFNGGRFSVEVQKLCFFADVYAVEKYRARLTSLEYGAYMYGPYSEEISERLDGLAQRGKIETRVAMRNGKTDAKYDVERHPDSLTNGQRQVLRKTVEQLEEYDPADLTDLSRENWMYKTADSGDLLSFEQYANELERGNTTPQTLPSVPWVGDSEEQDVPDGLSPL
jgi:uncharacterized protein YwgA